MKDLTVFALNTLDSVLGGTYCTAGDRVRIAITAYTPSYSPANNKLFPHMKRRLMNTFQTQSRLLSKHLTTRGCKWLICDHVEESQQHFKNWLSSGYFLVCKIQNISLLT